MCASTKNSSFNCEDCDALLDCYRDAVAKHINRKIKLYNIITYFFLIGFFAFSIPSLLFSDINLEDKIKIFMIFLATDILLYFVVRRNMKEYRIFVKAMQNNDVEAINSLHITVSELPSLRIIYNYLMNRDFATLLDFMDSFKFKIDVLWNMCDDRFKDTLLHIRDIATQCRNSNE